MAAATYEGRHALPVDYRVDVIRIDYHGKHRPPEVVVNIADRRQKRRRHKGGGKA
jgi:hypothetical protein